MGGGKNSVKEEAKKTISAYGDNQDKAKPRTSCIELLRCFEQGALWLVRSRSSQFPVLHRFVNGYTLGCAWLRNSGLGDVELIFSGIE